MSRWVSRGDGWRGGAGDEAVGGGLEVSRWISCRPAGEAQPPIQATRRDGKAGERRYRTNTSAGRTGVPERLSGQPMRNALGLARRDQKKARWEQDHDDKRLASSTTALGRSDPLIRLETLPRSTVAGSGPGQATGGSAKGATGMACGGASRTISMGGSAVAKRAQVNKRGGCTPRTRHPRQVSALKRGTLIAMTTSSMSCSSCAGIGHPPRL
ncbi:hypothetical protein PCL_07922 [Purpureocillium lilacinum]|uniref:Uncharacterized protein n=1 Tax=Purpureocillium lilacinum TaxID=33203 RepID=A0A2U3EJB8_PURLI|nr:hypothetical protein PCL_07922 [Purpureocillium lilacinum]